MGSPLAGIRVLELSTVLLAPYTAQMMGDMGADVIKIENHLGDPVRGVGVSRHPGMSVGFLQLNRNKRSLVLNLADVSGLKAFKRLIPNADVFIHNLRNKPATKLGITYQDLKPLNPKMIYCSTIGYNRRGPYGEKPAYDDLIQGATGIAALMGEHQQSPPRYVPSVIADKTGALSALSAILMALFHREQTGEGQEVEVSMFETMSAFMMADHIGGYGFAPPIDAIGHKRALSPFRKPYATQDGFLCLIPVTDRHWQRFFEIIGNPELIQDERFVNITQRTKYTHELYQILEQTLKTRRSEEWMQLMEEEDIPCGPVNQLMDLLENAQLQALDFFSLADHPSEGKIRQVGIPTVFSKTPGGFHRHAPKLGQHSIEVLQEAGLTPQEIQELLEDDITIDGR